MLHTLRRFDWRLTSTIASLTPAIRPLMLAITQLGGAVVVTLIMAAGIYLTYVTQEWQLLWSYLLTIVAICFNFLLKIYFRRRRPDTPYANAMRTKTYSFPSGHSFGAISAYGMSAMALSANVDPAYGPLIWLLAITITLLVGFSRVYLGAHYVLDVLGGWVLGAVYLSLIHFFGLA